MPSAAPRNLAKQKLAAGELVLCMGLRQARTADIALIAAASGFDAIYVDMDELKNEDDRMVGDDIAEQGIAFLKTVNFSSNKKTAAAAE